MESKVRLVWPIAGSLASAAVLMVASLIGASMAMDAGALRRETDLLRSGVSGRAEEIDHSLVSQVVWDDAVRHLDTHFDRTWAGANIGAFLKASEGIDSAFILNGENRLAFAAKMGAEVGPSAYAALAPRAAPLVRALRTAEEKRVRAGHASWSALISTPLQTSSFIDDGGRLERLTATLVQPDFGTVQPSAKAPVVVTTYPINGTFIDGLSRRFLAADMKLLPIGAPTPGGVVTISDRDGHPLRNLVWSPTRPGLAMLEHALPPFMVLLGMMAVGGLMFFREATRTAESLIASEAKATHLALHDFLTGLANRRLFSDRLSHALEQTRRSRHKTAVICLDLDRFKEVNDTFGHHIGDELVQLVAKRLHELCRASDTLARLGGDEFAILVPEATPLGALGLCDRIAASFLDPLPLSSGPVHITCSMGISLAGGEGATANELMRQADLALYRAKDLGRSRHCFFEQEMDAALKLRRSLENDLRQALAEEGLELHYQPQIDGGGHMTGVEALVRWTHSERGSVSPAVFVPIAEECGLIGDLGLFTLRRAFSDSARWPHLKVAVNVSARQIRQQRFIDDITGLVAATGVSPRQFELEITEGLLLDDDAHTHAVLRQLKEMGFSLALDDFGTGYSSLSYLRRYPIDKIKIDRSFITNLGVDVEAEAVVGAIVRLARALGLHVIAEGVETSQQRDTLLQVGCPEVQGFLFSPPVPCDEIDAFNAGKPFLVRGAGRSTRRLAAVGE